MITIARLTVGLKKFKYRMKYGRVWKWNATKKYSYEVKWEDAQRRIQSGV